MGTAAMAPRDIGGVVDSSLMVYGTTNLRVVDVSTMRTFLGCFDQLGPDQIFGAAILIAAHLQSTVWAVAEKVRSSLAHPEFLRV